MIFSNCTANRYVCTLREPVYYPGAVTSGAGDPCLTILPAEPKTGICFRRTDIDPDRATIKASWRNAMPSDFGTMLVNDAGVPVNRVSPIIAALRGYGIDNAVVEIAGSEPPRFDGSCGPLMTLIKRAGLSPQSLSRTGIWIERPLEVRQSHGYAILNPASVPRVTVNIEPVDAVFEAQCVSLEMLDHVFAREIAPARNLELETLPQGNSEIVTSLGLQTPGVPLIHNRVVPQHWGLRYRDELARHQLLQCYGDLSLAGDAIFGHLFVHQPNHRLMHALLQELFANRHFWSRLSYDSIRQRVEREHGELAMQIKLSTTRPH